MALVGTPTDWLMDLVAVGVHRADNSTSSPSGASSLSMGR